MLSCSFWLLWYKARLPSNGENIPKGGIQRHEHGGYRRCSGKGRKRREINVELTAFAGGAAAQVDAAFTVEEVELVIVRELVQRLQNGERVGFLALKGIIAAGQYGVSGCDDVGAAAIDVNTIEKGGHILLDIQNQSSGLFVKSNEEAGGIHPGNGRDIIVAAIVLHPFGIDLIGAGHPVEHAAFGGILPGGGPAWDGYNRRPLGLDRHPAGPRRSGADGLRFAPGIHR